MNKENSDIINKFLLIGDKFMPEMYLWDPKVKNILLVVHLLDMKNELICYERWKIKSYSCFQHDSAYAKYKDRADRG